MSELTDEEQKFFETGGEAEITPEVKDESTTEVEAEAEATETKEEEQKEEKREKTVPYGALHEERQLRKQAQEQLREAQDQNKKFLSLQEELKAFREAQRQQQEQAQAEEDPIAYTAKQVAELRQRQEEFERQQQQTSQQSAEEQQFLQTVHTHVMDFVQHEPAYPQALQYFVEQRNKEYEVLGYTDPVQRRQLVDEEAKNIARHALQMGKNPAQAVWDMATMRGFHVEQKQEKSATDTKIEKIAKGQKAAKSVSTAGTAPDGELSLTDIETMSDDEFDSLWAEMEKQG